MAGHGSGCLHWKLEDCGGGSSNHVLPEDRVNVGGLGVFPARVLLPLKAAMVRIVEFDNEPVDGLSLLLHVNEDSAAAIGETIQRVDVVDKHDLGVDLQLQFR